MYIIIYYIYTHPNEKKPQHCWTAGILRAPTSGCGPGSPGSDPCQQTPGT